MNNESLSPSVPARYIAGVDLGDPHGDSCVVWRHDPATGRLIAELVMSIDRCAGCRHMVADHLLALGPARLCLCGGCDCGRRAIAAALRAMAPWSAVVAAVLYGGWQLLRWWALGFRVLGAP